MSMTNTPRIERVGYRLWTLGNSPLWSSADAAWYGADIVARRNGRLDTTSGQLRHWKPSEGVPFLVEKQSGGLMLWSGVRGLSTHSRRGQLGLHTLIIAACILLHVPVVAAATTQVESWGSTRDGHPVQRVTFENDRGMRFSAIDYGATIVALEVPDREGALSNIVLSLPDLAAYEKNQRRYAAVMGRYAGRIANARFTLDGNEVELTPNARGVALHGDPDGYDRRLWRREDFADTESIGAVFHLRSPDGDQHFPGTLDVSVTYRLQRKRNEFSIEYGARTDAPTVLNLTNHAYLNLAGAGVSGMATHRFQIMADRYAQTDAKRVPTGVLATVTGTPLDFRQPSGLYSRLASTAVNDVAILGNPAGYDHSLVFARSSKYPAMVAVIEESRSGRRMEIHTTEPSVQFNSGNGFDGSEIGSEGRAYGRHDGFAFEPQHLPDSPNHAHFPSTALRPGEFFYSQTRFQFSTIK
jgi:aldose 1-epimerase